MIHARKATSVLLIIALLCGILPASAFATLNGGETPCEEAQTAIAMGLVPESIQKNYDQTITYLEYMMMLRRVVNEVDVTALPDYTQVSQKASESVRAMKREDAMLAVYETACVLGRGKNANGTWGWVNQDIEENHPGGDTLSDDIPEWENCNDICIFRDSTGVKKRYLVGAYYYAQDQFSYANFKSVFDYDKVNHTLHTQEELSREEAIVTILRFYQSLVYETEAETEQAIDGAANEKRDAILNSETTIVRSDTMVLGSTYTGNAYYVSSSEGNDSNIGTSPDHPWKTLSRVLGQAYSTNDTLTSGDAVFFKRGDTWRGEFLECTAGVTYSAYGTGAKPCFYGSKENGVGADRWTLYQEDGNKKYGNMLAK